MSPRLKRLLTLAGTLISVLAIGYIAHRLYGLIHSVDQQFFSSALVLPTLSFGAIYGVLLFLPAVSWLLLLSSLGQQNIPWLPGVRVYAASQIAKYLPGNVVHIMGRQILGVRLNWSHKRMALSSTLEIVFFVCAAALVSAASKILPHPWYLLGVVAGLAAVAIAARPWSKKLKALDLTRATAAFNLYVTFFFLAGLVFSALEANLFEGTSLTWASGVLIFSSSWLAGYVTPGAPGGLGVREAVMVLQLQNHMPPAQATVFAIMFRITTTLADVFVWGSSYLLPREARA